MLNNARFERSRKNMEKSDKILSSAVEKFPGESAVYLEYFLNHSNGADLKSRFDVLSRGYETTGAVPLAFFIGSSFLEEGELDKAQEILTEEKVAAYIKDKHVFILPLLYIEQEQWDAAENAFWAAHGADHEDEIKKEKLLEEMSAQDLLPLVMINRAKGLDWVTTMARVPMSSIHSDMSWIDYRTQLDESLKKPKTGEERNFRTPGSVQYT